MNRDIIDERPHSLECCPMHDTGCPSCYWWDAAKKDTVTKMTAAQEEANKFALLARDIVMAAEKWAHEYSARSSRTFATFSLLNAVAAYRKARSEDPRR